MKAALRKLGKDELMQRAQHEIAFEKYLKPALDACEGSDFVLPLSLCVIYDSMNHGSFAKIRDRVKIEPPGNGSMKPIEFEKLWITRYVMSRDRWLESIPRLAPTDYRTDFFIDEIRRGNWQLELPLHVHGVKLTASMFSKASAAVSDDQTATKAPSDSNLDQNSDDAIASQSPQPNTSSDQAVEAKQTEQTPAGELEIQTKNEQSVTEPAKVTAPEPYMGVGFWGVIKRDLAAATGGNLTFSSLAEYAQQASGWPEWVVGILSKLAIGVLIATFGYFLFRVVHYLVDTEKRPEDADRGPRKHRRHAQGPRMGRRTSGGDIGRAAGRQIT
jgi:hypothetical protein